MTSSPFNASDSGLLLVFMEPGPDVSLSEFHEWYDNEHVPLRTERFATFRSAARYQTVSSIFPSNTVSSSAVRNSGWGAYYTVSSNDVFAHASYTDLRSQRSQREAELFTRLAVVDRRIYRLCYDSHADARIHLTPKDGLAPQTKLHVEQHSNTIVAHSVTPANTDEYADWFDNEHALLLSKTPGWTRTRRFQLIDNGVNGTHASPEDAKQIPKFLGLHEYSNDKFDSTPEYKAALDTPWRTRVMGPNDENILQRERKTQTLYRAWDPTAALAAS